MRAHGAELTGEMQDEDTYPLAYIRGPEGILVTLAEQSGQLRPPEILSGFSGAASQRARFARAKPARSDGASPQPPRPPRGRTWRRPSTVYLGQDFRRAACGEGAQAGSRRADLGCPVRHAAPARVSSASCAFARGALATVRPGGAQARCSPSRSSRAAARAPRSRVRARLVRALTHRRRVTSSSRRYACRRCHRPCPRGSPWSTPPWPWPRRARCRSPSDRRCRGSRKRTHRWRHTRVWPS